MKRILSGIQPTNDLTLGNYLGSIKQFVEMQNEYEMFIFVADLHAITTGNVDSNGLYNNSLNLVKTYLAFGLNPNIVTLFLQSSICEHTELGYFLMCQTSIGELSRMTQFKDKTSNLANEENGTQKIPTGLLIYPCLMAADILLYSPDYVPVGIDQKQHLELTKTLANRVNKKFKNDIFKTPNVFISKNTGKILDLQDSNKKMSKSSINKKGVIFLNDPIDVSIKKIMSAKTDCLNIVNYDVDKQPEITNLINIYSGLTNLEPDKIVEKYVGENYGEFKKDLANLLENFLINFQSKYNSYNYEEVMGIISKGNKKAKDVAKQKLKEVYKNIGVVQNGK